MHPATGCTPLSMCILLALVKCAPIQMFKFFDYKLLLILLCLLPVYYMDKMIKNIEFNVEQYLWIN